MYKNIIQEYFGVDCSSKPIWNDIIDWWLVEWAVSPPDIEEGCEIASREVINIACQIAYCLRDNCAVAPDDVIQNGDGGINFIKYIDNNIITIMQIYEDKVKVLCFIDNELNTSGLFEIEDMIP